MAFEVRPAGVDELTTGDPWDVALMNATSKASTVLADCAPDRRVIGVDTLVTLDGEIFGKPADAAEASATLARLAGRTHQVLSGLALLGPWCVIEAGPEAGRLIGAETVAATLVTFRALTAAQIERYVATGEWRGRAGGYAIQERGAALVERIEGDYTNVVGLPVAALIELAGDLL